MTLDQLSKNQIAKIIEINTTGAIRQRILDMGIRRGETIKVIRKFFFGGPIWVNVSGTQLALRKSEAERIIVEKQGSEAIV